MSIALEPGKSSYRLGDLAEYLGAQLHGDAQVEVAGLATLDQSAETDLSFLSNPAYRKQLSSTQAGAVILAPDMLDDCPAAALVLDNPYLGFARISLLFDDRPCPETGCAPSAVISPSAKIDPTASVGPGCVVEDGVEIGSGTVIGAGCIIGERARLGADCYLHPRVVLAHRVLLGDRVTIQSGAVVGSDGFGFAPDGGKWHRIAQIGGVRIGNDVEIGANTSIDRGALDDTVIEDGVILDNQIQVAHNVCIGAYTAIAGCTAIAGSAVIGKHCTIGGGSGIAGHLEIADHVHVAGMSMVSGNIRKPGAYASGPGGVSPMDQWRKNVVRFRKLDELARRLQTLERKSGDSGE